MQPVCTAVSTPSHEGRGLAGQPRCVNVVRRGCSLQFAQDHRKSAVCSPPQCAARTLEVMKLLKKEAIEIVSPAQSESGFYSRYFFVPKKRRRPATYSRSQTHELRPGEKVVQDDHFETNPLANMPRGLVYVAGSERRKLSHSGSPPSQTILEICIRRGGLSIQGPAVWAVALLHDAWMRLSPI